MKKLIQDYDSNWKVDLTKNLTLKLKKGRKEYKINLNGILGADILGEKAVSTPVYLVKPETMEKYYKERKRGHIDEKCLYSPEQTEHIHKVERDIQEIIYRIIHDLLREGKVREVADRGIWLEYFHRCLKPVDFTNTSVALGLYMNKGFNDEPSILICPDRIENTLSKEFSEFSKIFNIVYLHEVAHAYMDVGVSYPLPFIDILYEEAIANLVAFNHQNRKVDKAYFNYLVSRQPFEYKAYKIFMDIPRKVRQVYGVIVEDWPIHPRKAIEMLLTPERDGFVAFLLNWIYGSNTIGFKYIGRGRYILVLPPFLNGHNKFFWPNLWRKIKKKRNREERMPRFIDSLMFYTVYDFMR